VGPERFADGGVLLTPEHDNPTPKFKGWGAGEIHVGAKAFIDGPKPGFDLSQAENASPPLAHPFSGVLLVDIVAEEAPGR
jgi:hypothetical protein